MDCDYLSHFRLLQTEKIDMTKRNKRSRLKFRASANGPIGSFSAPQKLKLARYFNDSRAEGRDVFYQQVVDETGIEKAESRICEMRSLGFPILTIPQSNPRKGDRRKLLRLAAECVLIEGDVEEGEGE